MKVDLKATVSDYIGKITAAHKATTDFSQAAVKSAEKHRAAWDKVGKGMVISGAAIGAAVILAVKHYADFQQQLSNVQAVSGATAGEMAKLSDAALVAGQATKYSATEAAQAESELAKLGISTSDILGGALTGSLNLAAAGNLNLADAATYAGQAMKIFNLNGKDVPHIADVLAAGANKSAADVNDLAQALQQGGLVAAQTGLTLEDTVGTLAAFSDNALNGSDAGTSFKTMLQRLNPQSQQAKDLMHSLGLEAYDAQGNFVGITTYAGKLQTALRGMSAEQRNAALQTIFGSDAVRAANVLYKEGADGIASYVKGVNDQGAASRVAAIQMDNLNGDLEQLRGSIDTALIKAGSAGNEQLRSLVQTATSAVNVFASMPDPVQKGALAVGAVTAAVLLLGGGLALTLPRVVATRAALSELGITSAQTATALKAVGAASIVLGVAAVGDELIKMQARASVADVSVNDLADSLDRIANGGRSAGALGDLFSQSGPFGTKVHTASEALKEFSNSAEGAFGGGLGNKFERFVSSDRLETFTKQLGEIDSAMAQMVQSGNIDGAAQLYDQLMASITAANKAGANIPVDEVASKFTKYQAAIDATNASQQQAAVTAQGFGGAVDGVQVSAEDATKAVDDLVQSLANAGLVQLSARDAARGYQQAIDDATASVKKNGKTLDTDTQKGRDNQSALDAVAKAAINQAQAQYDRTKATKGAEPAEAAFRKSLLGSRDSLVQTGIRMGLTKAEAKKYADQVLNIPAVKHTKVTLTGTDAALTSIGKLREALLGIHDKNVTVSVRTTTANKLGSQPGLDPSRFADGGQIVGPGTGTSDSVPLWGSNGEYMVKAAAVAKYGVSFFDHLNAMRFASGGLVSGARHVAPAAAAPAGAAPTVNFNGPLYSYDPTAIVSEQQKRARDAAAVYNLAGV